VFRRVCAPRGRSADLASISFGARRSLPAPVAAERLWVWGSAPRGWLGQSLCGGPVTPEYAIAFLLRGSTTACLLRPAPATCRPTPASQTLPTTGSLTFWDITEELSHWLW